MQISNTIFPWFPCRFQAIENWFILLHALNHVDVGPCGCPFLEPLQFGTRVAKFFNLCLELLLSLPWPFHFFDSNFLTICKNAFVDSTKPSLPELAAKVISCHKELLEFEARWSLRDSIHVKLQGCFQLLLRFINMAAPCHDQYCTQNHYAHSCYRSCCWHCPCDSVVSCGSFC